MTTSDAPAGAPSTPPPPPPPPASPPVAERKLTRSRDQKVIAGVCGGLGRYCGVDPLLFRIGLGVLVFFGGVGLVIYLAAWLLLPADGDPASPAEALLGRGYSSTSTVTTVILAVIGVCVLGLALQGDSLVLLALAVIGILLLVRRSPQPVNPSMAADSATGAPPAQPVPAAYAPHGPYGGSVGGSPMASAAPTQTTMPIYQPPPFTPPFSPPKPPKPPKERSALGRIVVSSTLVVLGLMLAIDSLFDVSIPGAGYVAAALGMVGAGLVAGAWLGRSRGLIALGVALCVALPITSAASGWDPGTNVGSQRWAPATASDILSRYELGFGDANLDLRSVDFSDTSAVTRFEVGLGHLVVHVPRDVDVTVHAKASAGNLNLFGDEYNGSDVRRTATDLGADGAGGGNLEINVEIGVGELEVIRD